MPEVVCIDYEYEVQQTELGMRYLGIDPTLTPAEAKPHLEKLCSEYFPFDNALGFMIGSIATELAVASEGHEARVWTDAAVSTLCRLDTGNILRQGNVAGSLNTLKRIGMLSSDFNVVPGPDFASMVEGARSRQADGPPSRMRGWVGEQVCTMLLESDETTNTGLFVYPSYYRQDRAKLVDGRVCRWDLSVESNGLALQKGTYFLQVKTSTNEYDRISIHPDVHLLSLREVFSDDHTPNYRGMIRAAEALLDGNIAHVARARQQLFEAIAAKGPSRRETFMLDRLKRS